MEFSVVSSIRSSTTAATANEARFDIEGRCESECRFDKDDRRDCCGDKSKRLNSLVSDGAKDTRKDRVTMWDACETLRERGDNSSGLIDPILEPGAERESR
mmetsp:Transcript_95147/g.150469  ORF Transcript_95147/g.150469 Transcript_95147/m.150469 type:complete len:101 (-) Transcript_95147:1467-1769(-)